MTKSLTPCRACGNELPGSAFWCPRCRTPVQRGETPSRRTSLTLEETQAALVRFAAQAGSQLTSQTATSVTGVVRVRRRPNFGVALVLALFFLVPAIIYLIVVSSATDTFPFAFEIVVDGGDTEVRWSGYGAGADVARGAVGLLPA